MVGAAPPLKTWNVRESVDPFMYITIERTLEFCVAVGFPPEPYPTMTPFL
jgi:hypothetical protein